MEEVFKVYTKGAEEMDGRTFVKLLQDTNVIDKGFARADADIVFAKVKDKGAKKIDFGTFEEALKLVAEKKKVSKESLYQALSSGKEGPILTGTLPDPVRFHDDKSTYTGVHKAGGPTTVDAGRVQFNDLSEVCDRSAYDIRGVKEGVMERKTGDSLSLGASLDRRMLAAAGLSPGASRNRRLVAPAAAHASKHAKSTRFRQYAAATAAATQR